jgi:serine/threonine protein kinase
MIMEYIPGIGLDVLLAKNRRFTPQRVGRFLEQLCDVLHAAHGLGIIHRDLKPSNLMVIQSESPEEQIKVMDFGLAKLIDVNPMSYHKVSDTGIDFAVGTPGYISPEQVRGDEVDHRSDLYSVGVILFELLTGQLPFRREETMDVLLAHATEPPPSFASLGASAWVSPAIEAVVQNCLAKNPADRPASARDLAELYEAALAMDPSEFSDVATPMTADETAAADGSEEVPGAELPAPPPPVFDPHVVVLQMEAWMPETIAAFKLRGFVHDFGGEVLESVPGKIRVRLGGKAGSY